MKRSVSCMLCTPTAHFLERGKSITPHPLRPVPLFLIASFRWYNCTYVLDATMVLLYVALANISPIPVEKVFDCVGKSLEIFSAMGALAVARRCKEVTAEVLGIAKQLHSQIRERADQGTCAHPLPYTDHQASWGHLINSASGTVSREEGSNDLTDPQELFSNLIDTDLVANFLDFDHWNAWSGWEYQR